MLLLQSNVTVAQSTMFLNTVSWPPCLSIPDYKGIGTVSQYTVGMHNPRASGALQCWRVLQ